MSGVEILSQNNVYETEAYPWLIAIFAGIGLLIGLVIAISDWVKYGFDASCLPVIIFITLGGAYIGFLMWALSEHETDTVDYIEYKVAISEDVNFTEFMDKYEVLDQEGKIYIVKERE